MKNRSECLEIRTITKKQMNHREMLLRMDINYSIAIKRLMNKMSRKWFDEIQKLYGVTN